MVTGDATSSSLPEHQSVLRIQQHVVNQVPGQSVRLRRVSTFAFSAWVWLLWHKLALEIWYFDVLSELYEVLDCLFLGIFESITNLLYLSDKFCVFLVNLARIKCLGTGLAL